MKNLEEISQDLLNGKIQIYNDDPSRFSLLFKLPDNMHINVYKKYYRMHFDGVTIQHDFKPFEKLPIIFTSILK